MLEQTDYADAASQRTGIGAFTNSIPAKRWSHSHYISMTAITHLLEDVGLSKMVMLHVSLKLVAFLRIR